MPETVQNAGARAICMGTYIFEGFGVGCQESNSATFSETLEGLSGCSTLYLSFPSSSCGSDSLAMSHTDVDAFKLFSAMQP